ncbi:MAG: NlpC/P60 family protein [Verrucomicrobiales bacterium]|nr:NlpC/P60 family protein [Verrucomicrobiales bacterium]
MNSSSFLKQSVSLSLLLAFSLSPATADARLFGGKERKVRTATSESRAPGAFFQAFRKPDYELPYAGWEFPRKEVKANGFFKGNPKPSTEMMQFISVVRARAEKISRFGLTYKFGGDHPTEGGMDCSGTMQFMLSDLGFDDMPRTSYQQYDWLKKNRTLIPSKSIPDKMGGRKGIKPGDLIFWGGTYNSGHKVSHVMIYLGQNDDGKHYMFGARGKKKKGLFGNGVDIFELSSGYQKSLVGFGTLPGVS